MSTTFDHAFRGVRAELRSALSRPELARLHLRSGARHALMALLPAGAMAAGVLLAAPADAPPWRWIPGSLLVGLAIFAGTVLLHEVVHGAVFRRRRPRVERLLALAYATPCGLSATQFTRWHLDHHRWLGTSAEDPKRAHLSPKANRRLVKALYLTPALFWIYLRAARRASASYPDTVVRTIRRERGLAILVHVGVLALLLALGGPGLALRLHLLPLFVVFPALFTLNRLGQHYDVDPGDPARWGTLLRPSPWRWDLVFLFSNYHLEHHYFPRVPGYRLPALRRALAPFFARRGVPERTYGGLLWDWFARNRAPHTRWTATRTGSPGPDATRARPVEAS